MLGKGAYKREFEWYGGKDGDTFKTQFVEEDEMGETRGGKDISIQGLRDEFHVGVN